MIPLDEQRSWFPFITIKCTSCNTRNNLVADHHFSINGQGDHPADQGDIKFDAKLTSRDDFHSPAAFAIISLGDIKP